VLTISPKIETEKNSYFVLIVVLMVQIMTFRLEYIVSLLLLV